MVRKTKLTVNRKKKEKRERDWEKVRVLRSSMTKVKGRRFTTKWEEEDQQVWKRAREQRRRCSL